MALICLTAQIFYCFFTDVNGYNFIFYILGLIFIATRMRALGNIMHEKSGELLDDQNS